MRTSYFLVGCYGIFAGKSQIASNLRFILELDHDGTPQGEADAMREAVKQAERKAIEEMGAIWRSHGFKDFEATWNQLCITPLITSINSDRTP